MRARFRVAVRGVVQGVGFRPFVYRLATDLRLSGFVRNDGDGATLEVEGPPERLAAFEARLVGEIPTGSRIDRVDRTGLPATGGRRFTIDESHAAIGRQVSLAPDRRMCPRCLAELLDPGDRRYRYPFINCTHCGPRYTITRALPYDRPNTTMAAFEMCPACRGEYETPADRRYHAQPVACPDCGPSVWLETGDRIDTADPLRKAVALLAAGKVLAVKGIGGFHLAVDGTDDAAVARLRALKRRPRKPLALMVRDVATARRLVRLDAAAEALLTSPAAPVVLAPAVSSDGLARWIADGVGDLGVMLPYSPLHQLLFGDDLPILVMTSGNAPSEPIIIDNSDARERLGADAALMHDRDIHVACDDSVVRATPHGPMMIRRARGYVPDALDGSMLPRRSVLALGALLKVTLTALHRGQLIVGRHLGDLDNLRAEAAFEEEVERMLDFGRFTPEAVVADQHPDLPSLAFAEARFPAVPLVRAQHHHAHMAAVMVEHGLSPEDRVAGVILDGFGHGPDGAVWGGEVLAGGYQGFERAAHLRYVPLPGGDRGAVEPRRMAISLLGDAGIGPSGDLPWDDDIARIARRREVSPLTSSAGRLFDGAAALLGIAPELQEYEGEAAMRLEAVAAPGTPDAYPLPLAAGTLDTRALTVALVEDRAPVPLRAARFINGLADGLAAGALTVGSGTVVLGGGCMVNRLLLSRLVEGLEKGGAKVLYPRVLPAGDGGVSAGQAAIAAAGSKEGV